MEFSPPDDFFWSSSHLEAWARLEFCVERRLPLSILCGPSGTGKTTLAQRFVADVRSAGKDAVLLEANENDPGRLASELARQLHGGRDLWEELACRAWTERPLLLLLDHLESSHSDWAVFVQRLVNLPGGAERAPVQVVLIGDERLPNVGAAHGWAGLRIDLENLTPAETAELADKVISSRFPNVAFEPSFAVRLHAASRGNPRRLLALVELCATAAGVSRPIVLGGDLVDGIGLETFGVVPEYAGSLD